MGIRPEAEPKQCVRKVRTNVEQDLGPDKRDKGDPLLIDGSRSVLFGTAVGIGCDNCRKNRYA